MLNANDIVLARRIEEYNNKVKTFNCGSVFTMSDYQKQKEQLKIEGEQLKTLLIVNYGKQTEDLISDIKTNTYVTLNRNTIVQSLSTMRR